MTTERPARARPVATGARALVLGTSVAATLALMAGMAAADHDPPTTVSPDGAVPAVGDDRAADAPSFGPTDAPPITSSHGS